MAHKHGQSAPDRVDKRRALKYLSVFIQLWEFQKWKDGYFDNELINIIGLINNNYRQKDKRPVGL